jgi:guanyl-specific ribonuclease Sa
MPQWIRLALLLFAALVAAQWFAGRPTHEAPAGGATGPSTPGAVVGQSRYPSWLPPQAIDTLQAIERGGPHPYDRDGSVFQNRERRLPDRPRGYYREYTVATPGSPDRGARRIVTGGQPPEVYYYTDDHYRSFQRLEIAR